MNKPELSSLLLAAIHAKYNNEQYTNGNKIIPLRGTNKVVNNLKLSFGAFGVSANVQLFSAEAKHDQKPEDLEIKYEFPVLQSYWSDFNARKSLNSDCCVYIEVSPDFFDVEYKEISFRELNFIRNFDLIISNSIRMRDLSGGTSVPTFGLFNCYVDMDIYSPIPLKEVNSEISISIYLPGFVVKFPALKAIYNGTFLEDQDLIEKIHCVCISDFFVEFEKPLLAAAEK